MFEQRTRPRTGPKTTVRLLLHERLTLLGRPATPHLGFSVEQEAPIVETQLYLQRAYKFKGADRIRFWLAEERQEKPLNVRTHCHLLILALSLGGPREPFGHPNNPRTGNSWQQFYARRSASGAGNCRGFAGMLPQSTSAQRLGSRVPGRAARG
jgi:hypothetical protein